jgi:hypothetical protein
MRRFWRLQGSAVSPKSVERLAVPWRPDCITLQSGLIHSTLGTTYLVNLESLYGVLRKIIGRLV